MKELLLRLLNNYPATAGRPEEFLDTLADDIQALIIRAIAPGDPNDATEWLEHNTLDVYNDHFGVKLYNLFTTENFNDKVNFGPPERRRIVMAMIQTMLIEQDTVLSSGEYTEASDSDIAAWAESGEQAATLKRRLDDNVLVLSPTVH